MADSEDPNGGVSIPDSMPEVATDLGDA